MCKSSAFYIDWLLMLFLAMVMSCILIGTARITFGGDQETWRAKAAAAIAIHNFNRDLPSPRPPVAAESSGPEKDAKAGRPVVMMYSATWCVPCQQAKAELNRAKLPFDVRVVDVSRGGQPDWCDSIPAFAWLANGRTRFVLGFPGTQKLIASWKASHGSQIETAEVTSKATARKEVP